MNRLQTLKTILEEIISLEKEKSIDDLASYIVGEVFGEYWDIYEANSLVVEIGELASDIEARSVTGANAESYWQDIKKLTTKL